ncbi:uncharacterized protein LOC134823219 [Bolinopsis microptera]|uniref:uncharacterized protein LOC134823219 n=1 Tax=Bolinopsis microptera TaxID=2820187 RepID=UPI003079EF09
MTDTVDYSYYRDTLEGLGCPYISALDNESLKELLFRAGEARLRFFTWLISKLSPHIDTELNSPVLSAHVKDSKIQRLLKVCSGLGLCGRNDYEIIQGNCSVKRQSRFYTRALEMLSVSGGTPRDPNLSHDKNSVNLCNNTSRDCFSLVDGLVNSSNFKDLFRTDLDVFPASLMCFNKTGKKTQPSEEKLLDRSGKLAEELETIQEKLSAIQNEHPSYEELDSERLVGHKKTLTNTLGTLSQIIGTFSGCYNEEFKHWAHRPAVDINDIGPLCKQLDEQLSKVLKFLENVKEFNSSVDYIESVDLNQKLIPVLPQTDIHELSERLRTLREQVEFTGVA